MAQVIPLQGGYNFRDLGGYPTQDGSFTQAGVVFRSGALVSLTDADRVRLRQLNIGAVIDLRLESEHASEGVDQLGQEIALISMPNSLGKDEIRQQIIEDAAQFKMLAFYKAYLHRTPAYHAQIFGHILAQLEGGSAVVVHCSAGKDRTGIVAALLLRLAGVDDARIVADYAATAHHLDGYATRQRQIFRGYGMPEPVIEEMLSSPPATMAAFLAYLDAEFGSAAAYLRGGGVTNAQIDAFKRAFLAR